MNSTTYIEVRQRQLILEMLKVFPYGNGLFQQDLATWHTSRKVKKFMGDNITTLRWLGNSADVYMIENLWGISETTKT